jgi:type IV secretory pathway VirB9-like protein
MQRIILALVAGTVLSRPAWALDPCVVTPADQQTRVCIYNPDQRYVVTGIVGFPVNLQFGGDETLKRAEFAFTGQDAKGKPIPTWRGPSGDKGKAIDTIHHNNLPVWPLQQGISALLVTMTMPDGSERTYQFALTAYAAPDAQTTSELIFTYPQDVAKAKADADQQKKAAALAAWRARRDKIKEDVAIARLKTDVFYGSQNYRYQAKADPRFKYLAPSKVSDNGWLTEFQWPGNVQIPTVTLLDPASGEERTAATSQQGNMVIVNGTSQWFRLRLGKAVMDIHNLAWSPNRPDPGTGTTSPDVVRTVIYGSAH